MSSSAPSQTSVSVNQAQGPAAVSSFVRQAAIRRKTRKPTSKRSLPPPSLVPSVAELCRFFERREGVRPASDRIDSPDAVFFHADNNNAVGNDPNLVASATIVTTSANADADAPDVVGTVITSVDNGPNVVTTATTATVATAGAPIANIFTAANFTTVIPTEVGVTSGGSPVYPVFRNYGIPTSNGRRRLMHVQTTEAALYGPVSNTVIVSMDPKKKKIRIDAGSGNLLLSVNNRSSTNDYILHRSTTQAHHSRRTRQRSTSACGWLCCWRQPMEFDDYKEEGHVQLLKVRRR